MAIQLRSAIIAGVTLVAVGLAGCGGGGGGSSAKAPPPVTPVAPPATPTKSGTAVVVTLNQVGANGVTTSTPGQRAVTLNENIAAGTASFSGTGLATGSITRDGGDSIVTFYKSGDNEAIIGRNNQDPTLSDARYGIIVTMPGTTSMNVAGFHYGTLTPATSRPTNVTATYTGVFGGVETSTTANLGPVSGRPLAGASSVTANFGTGQVNGRITNIQEPLTPTIGLPTGYEITMNGTMTGSSYSGTATIVNPGTTNAQGTAGSSSLSGGFYGTNATETAGALSARSTIGSTTSVVTGGFGGRR